HNILQLVGQHEAWPSDVPLTDYVWISPPDEAPPGGEIVRAQLIVGPRQVTQFRLPTNESRPWADAYPLTRDIGYIFAPEEVAPYVYLAAERILRLEFGVRIPNAMRLYAKQNEESLTSLRTSLAAKGYYSGAPFDLRPIPHRLTRADVD